MSHRKTIDPLARNDAAEAPLFARQPDPEISRVAGPTHLPFEHRDVMPSNVQQTSVEAHRKCDRDTDRLRVMRLIHTAPRTIDEVAAILGRPPNAVSGRFNDLEERAFIRKTEARRKTRSGVNAVVWSETGLGSEYVKRNQ